MLRNAFIFVVPGVALLTPWMQNSFKVVENHRWGHVMCRRSGPPRVVLGSVLYYTSNARREAGQFEVYTAFKNASVFDDRELYQSIRRVLFSFHRRYRFPLSAGRNLLSAKRNLLSAKGNVLSAQGKLLSARGNLLSAQGNLLSA